MPGCARGGRACIAYRGRAALRNFATLRADFARSANGTTPARCKRRDPRVRLPARRAAHAHPKAALRDA